VQVIPIIVVLNHRRFLSSEIVAALWQQQQQLLVPCAVFFFQFFFNFLRRFLFEARQVLAFVVPRVLLRGALLSFVSFIKTNAGPGCSKNRVILIILIRVDLPSRSPCDYY